MNHSDTIKSSAIKNELVRLEQASDIPSAIQGGRLLIRGSDDWEHREINRMFAGCYCISGGSIDEAEKVEKYMQSMHKTRAHIVRP